MVHPDDMLNVVLDALDEVLVAIDRGAKPWSEYEASFGGPDTEDTERMFLYVDAVDAARQAVSRRLSVSAGL